jgi:hypothetical protein
MPPAVLYCAYMVVMGGAATCFVTAYRRRHDTPRHVRWALTGFALDMAGTLVVLVVHRGLGWELPATDLGVVLWHRRLAYVTTGILLVVVLGGWRRWTWHPPLARAFLPLYLVTLALALVGYWPF